MHLYGNFFLFVYYRRENKLSFSYTSSAIRSKVHARDFTFFNYWKVTKNIIALFFFLKKVYSFKKIAKILIDWAIAAFMLLKDMQS